MESLGIPDVPSVEYPKNFLRTVVCEARFPTLLAIEQGAPAELQRALRPEYPTFERQVDQVALPGGGVVSHQSYRLVSPQGDWAVTLSAQSISLQTSNYVRFPAFLERFETLVQVALPYLETNEFTRLGLRYVNEIPVNTSTLDGWIRPELLGPFASVSRQTVQQVQSDTKSGTLVLRHGYVRPGDPEFIYTLDFDWSVLDVTTQAVADTLASFHGGNFSLFSWCLGPKARAWLESGGGA